MLEERDDNKESDAKCEENDEKAMEEDDNSTSDSNIASEVLMSENSESQNSGLSFTA